jgi:hypothetical protein
MVEKVVECVTLASSSFFPMSGLASATVLSGVEWTAIFVE